MWSIAGIMQVKPLKYKNMTSGLDDSNLHKGNGMNFTGYVSSVL